MSSSFPQIRKCEFCIGKEVNGRTFRKQPVAGLDHDGWSQTELEKNLIKTVGMRGLWSDIPPVNRSAGKDGHLRRERGCLRRRGAVLCGGAEGEGTIH